MVCFEFLTPHSLSSDLLRVNCYENLERTLSVWMVLKSYLKFSHILPILRIGKKITSFGFVSEIFLIYRWS